LYIFSAAVYFGKDGIPKFVFNCLMICENVRSSQGKLHINRIYITIVIKTDTKFEHKFL